MKVPACALAPVEGALAAKARIPTEHDAHVGPLRTQPPYQQSEDGRCMLHPVDVAGPQVGAQQLLVAEHVPRKIAVAVVVTVNDVALLLTMQRVGGASKSSTNSFEAGNELISSSTSCSHQAVARSTDFSRRHRWVHWRVISRSTPMAICRATSWRSVVVEVFQSPVPARTPAGAKCRACRV